MLRGKRIVLSLIIVAAILGFPLRASAAPSTSAEEEAARRSLPPILSELSSAAQSQHVSALIGVSAPSEQAVSALADLIYDMGRDEGFSGQVVDPEERSIDVYWKGRPAPAVLDFVNSRPFGVRVTLHEGARFTRIEEAMLANRIHSNASLAKDVELVSTSLRADGSGLFVDIQGAVNAAKVSAVRNAARSDALELRQVNQAPVPQSRQNDYFPWAGGIRTRINGSPCSAGFAVLLGNQGRLATAHHCDPSANAVVTDGAGQVIAPGGNYVTSIPSIDSQLLDPIDSPATIGKIYWGSWNTNTLISVKGWASNWVGDNVCNNGATSGQRCGKITDDGRQVNGLSGNFYIEAEAYWGWLSAHGDSGGPWTASATVNGGVIARGIHYGGTIYAPCGDVDPTYPTSCTWNSIYVPISVILNTWRVSLETS